MAYSQGLSQFSVTFLQSSDKNDCEINAEKRLLARLKKNYPRLPVCIQGDALYAAETVMKLCNENHWEYILTQKKSRQPLLAESYEWICEGGGAKEVKTTGAEKRNRTVCQLRGGNIWKRTDCKYV